jgi:adenylate cyclase
LKLYDRALELQPGHASAHFFLGMALLCLGNIPAAEAALCRSIELDPLSASDCARLAYLHYVKGDHRSAAEHLERSFDLDRDYPEALFYKGLLHFQQQDYGATVECLRLGRSPLDMGLLAAAYARQGKQPQAEKCVEGLRRLAASQYITPLAEALAAIGLKTSIWHFNASMKRSITKQISSTCWQSSHFFARSRAITDSQGF